nr:heavy metal-associated isoprenylated plant protein 47-like [Ipomoea batatas]GMC63284.1 heavy metal-associated isoprenylated plant protein 47-like [Ipomoea batatas]
MQQKIIISFPVSTDKCRALAMKTAVSTKGVKSVDIVEEKNHLVVNGEGIDSYILMKRLKKKFRPYPPYPVYQPVYDTYSQSCSIV